MVLQLSTMVLRSLRVTEALAVLPSCLVHEPSVHGKQPVLLIHTALEILSTTLPDTWALTLSSILARQNQTAKFFVACVYAPYGELESTNPGIITKFYKTIETHLLRLPSDTTPIIGGGFNASIGIHSNPDDACIIGPYGLPHSNSAGENLIDKARNCSLQASSTYFKQCSYETFYDLRNDRAPRQLDLIFMHQRHGPHVTDAGVFQSRNNIVSDHHATRLNLCLT
jgi:hypothetical protein